MKIHHLMFITSLLVFSNVVGCNDKRENDLHKAEYKKLRFQKIEEIKFPEFYNSKGEIYLDTETGVKYLKAWDGAANGGPIFTRLWDK